MKKTTPTLSTNIPHLEGTINIREDEKYFESFISSLEIGFGKEIPREILKDVQTMQELSEALVPILFE